MYKNFFDPSKYSEVELKIIEKLMLFDSETYILENPDLVEAEVQPFHHFITTGMYEARPPWNVEGLTTDVVTKRLSNLFDSPMSLLDLLGFNEDFYAKNYPDVPDNFLFHFLSHGMRERRNAFAFIDHLESETIAWQVLKKYGLDKHGTLDLQLSINIANPSEFINQLLQLAALKKIKPKAYRNNFWMALAIGFTAKGYCGAAALCYNYFYNYLLPMPHLGNDAAKMYAVGKIHNTATYAKEQGWTVLQLPVSSEIVVPEPVFLNRSNANADQDVSVAMPIVNYCQLDNVVVFGLNSMILHGSHDMLYDYHLPNATERQAEIKGPNVLHFINENCSYWYEYTDMEFAEAYSLLHDHSHNYFHWLIEVLPRLLLARKNKLFGDIPLLIDEQLSPLLTELLESLVSDPSLLIRVPRGRSVAVKKLHWVSDLSVNTVHTDKIPHKTDILISPTALELLQEVGAPYFKKNVAEFERVLITRTNVSFRRLINRNLLSDVLNEKKFWNFNPGNVLFAEQVRVFSNARIIIGEAGAALANIVFCQPGTIVVVLVNGFKNSNYYYLAEMARSAQLKLVFFECLRLEGTHKLGVHDDMIVDIQEFEFQLQELIEIQENKKKRKDSLKPSSTRVKITPMHNIEEI